MRVTVTSSVLVLLFLAVQSCGNSSPEPTSEQLQKAVVSALDAFVAELVAERPTDSTVYAERLRAYLDAHPAFYGGAVALLDETGTVTGCPYVYRTEDGYHTTDLAKPSYNIEGQDWFTMPLKSNAGIWTTPYFDSDGGEIWMITRSVLMRDGGNILAVVTTDLPVDPP